MKTESKYLRPSHYSKTRKGTKPNHAEEKLVNVEFGGGVETRRVRLSEALKLVERGWKFCPKKSK